jgi:predicted metal-binding membrane protein
MAITQPMMTPPMRRERGIVLVALLVTAAGAWALLAWQSSGMDDEMSLTMGMGALLFLATWIVMMVAMMFPTAAPMITTFTRVQAGNRARGQSFVPTWVFTGGYLLVWGVFGVVAYGAAVGAERWADNWAWLMDNGARIGGVVLVAAGAYQLSPLKGVCLSKCRSPLSFILSSWRDGYGGAIRMGVQHGAYCLGCCWLLFVILFPLGIMNVAAMAAITLLIFAEKSLWFGKQASLAAGLGLVVYGLVVLAWPDALPMGIGSTSGSGDAMSMGS